MENIFNNIYENKVWSNDGNGSGQGSSIQTTINLRKILSEFVIKHDINVIVDAPCGSCLWSKTWIDELKSQNKSIKYYGFDICKEPVYQGKKIFSETDYDYDIQQDNIATCCIPETDLIFCRDTLQHLCYENIFSILRNFSKSNAKWYIIGGYKESNENKNIADGEYFDFNITLEPFNLKPNEIIQEHNINWNGKDVKYLFVFNGDSFRSQIKSLFKID